MLWIVLFLFSYLELDEQINTTQYGKYETIARISVLELSNKSGNRFSHLEV